ncbi:MAG: lamin tail domain-containing protein [Myxococcota bacterium]
MALALLVGCGRAPPPQFEQVGYRDDSVPGQPSSGERGTVKITEVFWSGSVTNDGVWDDDDVFVELRNEGNQPINLSRWRLQLQGPHTRTWVLPDNELVIPVDSHVFLAATDTGCFPNPDLLVPGLSFTFGDPFELTLLDADERLIEPVGSEIAAPFAGGYDGNLSRSMERIELMFGGEGTYPHVWHYYTEGKVDVPNNDRVAASCRERTLASPGRPNSPDYSGAFAAGSLE